MFKVCLLISIFFIDVLFAGHPIKTEDTGTLGRLKLELEIPVEYCPGTENDFLTLPFTAGIGLTDNIDFYTGINHHVHINSQCIKGIGLSDIFAEIKYIFYSGLNYSAGLKAGITFPTAKKNSSLFKGKSTFAFNFLFSRKFYDFEIFADAGYLRNENLIDEQKDMWNFYLAAVYSLNNEIKIYGEAGVYSSSLPGDEIHPSFVSAGSSYKISDLLAVDGLIQLGLNKRESNLLLITSITFSI